MDYGDFLNENEINDENSQRTDSKNSNDNKNINNNINKSINNNNSSSNNNIEKENENENDEKFIFDELNKLEEEKQKFNKQRQEQNEILEKYMNTLKSLQEKSNIEFKKNEIIDTSSDLDELIKYNTQLNEIESKERILEEEIIYFEKYRNNFNQIYEDKQKEIEDMSINYEKEKEELDKKLEILEKEEKRINDKENNFEFEKKILTGRYNKAINKEADLLKTKIKLENSFAELDRRNSIFEKNNEFINQTKKELEFQITKNINEEKRLFNEKNNLKIRQDMVDSLRIKYVGDITNSPFELMPKTFNENITKNLQYYVYDKIEEFKNNNFSTINQNQFSNFNNNNYNYNINNMKSEEYINYNNNINNHKKLSIIEEDKKYSEGSISNKDD